MSRSLLAELKRRNVFRAAILYIGVVWALSQGAAQLLPVFDVPNWVVRWFIVAAIFGFPFWIAFAWFFELTPEGLKLERDVAQGESIARQTGRELDFAIFSVMAVAIVLLLTDRFVLHHGVNEEAAIPFPERSIAVLPFANLSSDKDQDYFSDGISEDLLNLLTKVPQLQVTARTSSFSFKGQNVAIPEIARRLHVAHVLEGSVQKSGNAVRITVQLVDAATDAQRWSQTWDRKLDDIFKIQDEIAAEVVKELKVKLLGSAPKARPTDPQAYALYLQALQLGRQKTAAGFEKSDALYRQALAIDPRYVLAWVRLAENYFYKTEIGVLPNQEGGSRAREAAEKALEIDPDCAPAHAELGFVAMTFHIDLAGAAMHFQRALALDPTDPDVLLYAGILLQLLGRLDEALAVTEAVIRRDPVNVTALHSLGYIQRDAGRYDASIATYRTILNLNPGAGSEAEGLGIALLLKGDASAALAEIEQETSGERRVEGLSMAYHALGRKADSDAALAALIAKREKESSYNIAYVYAFRREADKAFEWLDKAVEYQDSGLCEIAADNLFDNIRADPRWPPFLHKLGMAPEQLSKIEFTVTLPKEWQAEAKAATKAAAPAAH